MLRIQRIERVPLMPVEIREREKPLEGPFWFEREDGLPERLTRRWDRGSQMLGMVIACAIVALFAFGLGVVHGRVNPAREVPVGEIRQ